jgi:hypothetical protein
VRILKWVLPTLTVAAVAAQLRKELPAMRRYIRIARM